MEKERRKLMNEGPLCLTKAHTYIQTTNEKAFDMCVSKMKRRGLIALLGPLSFCLLLPSSAHSKERSIIAQVADHPPSPLHTAP